MTDEKIKALIAQVEQMIADQEKAMEQFERGELVWVGLVNVISGMRQVLAVIRLYEEKEKDKLLQEMLAARRKHHGE